MALNAEPDLALTIYAAEPASPTAQSLTRTKSRAVSGWSPARGWRVRLMNWPWVTGTNRGCGVCQDQAESRIRIRVTPRPTPQGGAIRQSA